jgi:hypothetical protein
MGPFGAGKTTAWLNWAKWAHETGSPMKFYALDTENALDAFLEPGSQYEKLDFRQGGNVEWVQVHEWLEYTAAVNVFADKLTRDDALVVDFISPAWEAVQNFYVEEMFHQDSDEYFLEARKNLKGGNPLDGWKDWQYINRLYKGWINKVLYKTPGHKYFTAQADAIRDTDDRGLRAIFGAHGVRPKGQKELGHQTHTVLLGSVSARSGISLTTIKDRERERLSDLTITDFTIDYLVNIAGWTL